jgi:Tfp pilus assembly protein PilN
MAQVQINLLTKEFRVHGSSAIDGVSRWVVIGGILGMLSITGWQFLTIHDLETEKVKLKADSNSLNATVEKVQKMKALEDGVTQAENNVKKIRAGNSSANVLLTDVQSRTPAEVVVQSLALAGGTVTLNLTAANFWQVEQFVDSLRADKIFSGVTLASLGLSSKDGGASVQAAINFTYGKVAKGK